MYIKGFDKDLKCRDFQFEVGKIYDTGCTEDLELCTGTVFHFCDSLEKVNEYYYCNDEKNRYCEIEVLGEIISDENKMGSNKIKIVREITGEELELLKGHNNENTGLFNSGYCNVGDFNSGCCNTGDFNVGDFNVGENNVGDFNVGDFNSGNNNCGHFNVKDFNVGNFNGGVMNTGSRNSGSMNSGDWNSGNWNSGYFNSCNGSSGIFCTEEPTVKFFDKDTNMTLSEFRHSKYYKALKSAPFILTEWIKYTEEEKKNDVAKRSIGGYLKGYTYKEACVNWWNKMTEDNKEIVMSIPNFDADKFYTVTGIRV